ncbi:MAG: MarR family winged helix-turn-helix transcriptional regulator [Ferruginibacter sp.]
MKDDVINKIREFNRFYTGIIGITNNHILESQYSLSEVRVMFEIYHNPKITAREIKETIQVDEGYLSRLISKLVKQNIIIKMKSKEDNRISSLTLSKKGQNIFLELNQRSTDVISETIQHLSKSDKLTLMLLFEKIKTLLTK